jgi:hypothetical protein
MKFVFTADVSNCEKPYLRAFCYSYLPVIALSSEQLDRQHICTMPVPSKHQYLKRAVWAKKESNSDNQPERKKRKKKKKKITKY